MRTFISRIRQPVKRERAEHYLLLSVLSFAASVLGTRLFLEIAGYPQLGTSELHIAHVLWGGLLLFVAALLPLILANREVYTIGGLLSGIGVGLFIDEIGKFITQTNDYFYPAAAPLIYAFFILTVLLYARVRRPPSRNARAELYRALDTLGEVLDHDLEPHERAELEARLRWVAAQADQPQLARLATALLDFVASEELLMASDEPRFWKRLRLQVEAWEQRWLRRTWLKGVLVAGLGLLGLPALMALAAVLMLALPADALSAEASAILQTASRGAGIGDVALPMFGPALTVVSSLPLLAAAVLLALGKERRGLVIGQFGLLFALTIVNVLVFYVEQFLAVSRALIEFGLLLAAMHYRRRFL